MRALHTTLSWPDPDTGPWGAVVFWREIGGRLECVALDLSHGVQIHGDLIEGREPQPITTGALRDLKVKSLIAAARKKFIAQREATLGWAKSAGIGNPTSTMSVRSELGSARSRSAGKPRYGSDHWQRVAAVYNDAFDRTDTPRLGVARQFGVTPEVAAKWIHRCRVEFNTLPPTTAGKAKAENKGEI